MRKIPTHSSLFPSNSSLLSYQTFNSQTPKEKSENITIKFFGSGEHKLLKEDKILQANIPFLVAPTDQSQTRREGVSQMVRDMIREPPP